ncbi:MAG: hypothetical protein AAF543_19205, partial [Pseudomonadota bacterium]
EFDNLLNRARSEEVGLKIKRASNEEKGRWYRVTIEGIDVYTAAFDPGIAWLFSADCLETVKYSRIGAEGHMLLLEYKPISDSVGALKVIFKQAAHWRRLPIYEIQFAAVSD